MSQALLSISSHLTDPICWCSAAVYRARSRLLPNEFDFSETKVKEVFQRCKLLLAATFLSPIAVVLGALGKPFRWAGFALQKDGFTHIAGDAPEKKFLSPGSRYSIMNWNLCGVGGGMSRDHGGVGDWPNRLKGIVETIREQDPDVLILEEIYDAKLGEQLIAHLKDRYAHFYMHIGPCTMGIGSGIMVMTKFPTRKFTFTPFDQLIGELKWSNRGFVSFEVQALPRTVVRIVGAHLQHEATPEGAKTRTTQLAQIIDHLAAVQLRNVPMFVVGDLNIDRNLPEHAESLKPFLTDSYKGDQVTYTNRFYQKMWDPNEPLHEGIIDYVSQVTTLPLPGAVYHTRNYPRVSMEGILVPAHDGKNTKTVLSDHHAVIARIKG